MLWTPCASEAAAAVDRAMLSAVVAGVGVGDVVEAVRFVVVPVDVALLGEVDYCRGPAAIVRSIG